MAELIYGLCTILSLAIAVMLWRQHRRMPTRMIYWTALCFSGLALSNLLLVLDKLVVPDIDLRVLRHTVSLLSIGMLLFGLVYEDE
jgi:hydrogenase/urease accessory protein HupE